MKLEWMGDKRELVQKFMRLFNTYARQYSQVYSLKGTGIKTSSSQIQTLEGIIEANGEKKMSEIAARMGITRGAFSNNVKKLISEGYLEKRYNSTNKKDIYLTVTPKGLMAYKDYSKYIYKNCFEKMFALIDTMPKESQETMMKILDGFTDAFNSGVTD